MKSLGVAAVFLFVLMLLLPLLTLRTLVGFLAILFCLVVCAATLYCIYCCFDFSSLYSLNCVVCASHRQHENLSPSIHHVMFPVCLPLDVPSPILTHVCSVHLSTTVGHLFSMLLRISCQCLPLPSGLPVCVVAVFFFFVGPSRILVIITCPFLCVSMHHSTGVVSSAFLNLALSAMILARHDVNLSCLTAAHHTWPYCFASVLILRLKNKSTDSRTPCATFCMFIVFVSDGVVPKAPSFQFSVMENPDVNQNVCPCYLCVFRLQLRVLWLECGAPICFLHGLSQGQCLGNLPRGPESFASVLFVMLPAPQCLRHVPTPLRKLHSSSLKPSSFSCVHHFWFSAASTVPTSIVSTIGLSGAPGVVVLNFLDV